MAQSYLGDGYGTHGEIDPDRGDDRGRRDRDQDWRGERQDWRGRDLFFSGRDEGDQYRWRSWTGERWPEQRGRADSYDRQPEGWSGQRRRPSAHPDDHYLSWRDRHMNELDRDYADYCRERESQFNRDFEDWRRQKYGNPQPLRTGMTQSGISHDPTGMTQAAEDDAPASASEPDPTADATLGTNSGGGRRRG